MINSVTPVEPQPNPPEVAAFSDTPETSEPIGEEATVDFDALKSRVESDLDLLREVIELYLECAPQMLAEVEVAVARCDRQAIEQASHSLKGAMLNIGAGPAARAAARLEIASRRPDFVQIRDLFTDLKQENAVLVTALQSHC